MKSGKYDGTWWLPEHVDSKIRGALVVATSNLTLEVESDFSDDQELFPHHAFIHGEFYDEEQHKEKTVTLHSLQMVSKSNSGSYQKCRYKVDYVLEGKLFYNTEQMQFKIISMEMDHLDNWLSTSLIEIKREGIKTTIAYDTAKQQLYDIDGHFKLEIYTNTGYDNLARPFKELTIKQKSHINLYFEKNISMKTLIDIARHLQDFFSFALGNTVRVISIGGVVVPDSIPKERIPIPFVDLTYLTITSNLPIKQLDEFMINFRYFNIKERFPQLVKNWFDNKDRLSVILNLYSHDQKFMRIQTSFC